MGQPTIPPTPSGTDLSNKTVIVTGGNAGLGYEAARQLLVLYASRVIIAVRSAVKGEEAVASLKLDPEVKKHNPTAIIEAFVLDLDDYNSGLSFAQRVKQEVKELDILLCNGGVNIMKYQKSVAGHERVMQVNCYTHVLIALELLPLLQATSKLRNAPTHLTFVGSATQTMHTLAKKPVAASETVLGHFDDQNIYSGLTRYSDSKLAVNAYVRRLSALVSPSEVIVNNLCPGLVATGFDKQLPAWLKPLMFVYRKIAARDVHEGSRTLVYASAIADTTTHGEFLQSNKIDPGAPFLDQSAGKTFTDKLWAETVADIARFDENLKVYA
ncbi:putative carbonyl reductase [Aureobasidium pullulans]|uniref:Putative carbonyl reductase n=1 Tax=Aureobasidium pullulans TaxID=5580 RepID=A0A4S9XHC7_AURPU|nr:putative carbonyl reductase [Aureobasidium pullulans]